MYCRNCGASLASDAVVCTNCEVRSGVGNNYCQSCGSFTEAKASVCMKCGGALKNNDPNAKSKLVAGILGILLGTFGVHNFYLGYTGKAILQLALSILSCGTLAPISTVWGVIEGIMILSGNISTDASGAPLTE